jgi:hypothetical protein
MADQEVKIEPVANPFAVPADGDKGTDGSDGKDGADGADGKDGAAAPKK